MPLESGTYISDLVATNPPGTDGKSQGDDHLRLIKTTIKNTFPNINAAVTPTPTELNQLANINATTISAAQWAGLGAATTFGISLWDDADAAAGRATLSAQAQSARLDEIAALAVTNGNFIVGNGSSWVAESGATARTSLGLGSLATLSSVNNGNWSGTDLAIANGGTGSSTASGARTALGLAIGSDVQAFDADLTTYGSNPLTAAELQQLQNINTVTISNTQWTGLGALDQTLSTGDNVEFNSLKIKSTGTQLNNIVVDASFTPGISFGDGTTGITYSTQAGTYTRINNLYIVTGQIVLSNKGSSSGIARITGLPASVGADTIGVVLGEANFSGLAGAIFMDIDGAADTDVPLREQGASGDSNLNEGHFTNTSQLSFMMCYHS